MCISMMYKCVTIANFWQIEIAYIVTEKDLQSSIEAWKIMLQEYNMTMTKENPKIMVILKESMVRE